MNFKKVVNPFLRRFGYRIQRVGAEPTSFGVDPFRDMRELIPAGRSPVVFDVGANIGQTIANFSRSFDRPTIHAFEPSREAFAELQGNTGMLPRVTLNNFALGARSGEARLFESAAGTPMNSLLEPRAEGWGGGVVRETVPVHVSTVDEYCGERGIDHIDILKTDTQGYDFEVIKGAAGLLARRAVHLIYMEIIFSDMYRGLPRMDEIYGFLADRGFVLVTFYPFAFWGKKASWTEGLFVHPEYRFGIGT
jgi:FkbM family methyltransferase